MSWGRLLWKFGEVKLVILFLLGTGLTYVTSRFLLWLDVKQATQWSFLVATLLAQLLLVGVAFVHQRKRQEARLPRGSLWGMEFLFYRASRNPLWETLVTYKFSFLVLWLWGLLFYPVLKLIFKIKEIIRFLTETDFPKLGQSYVKSILFQKKFTLEWERENIPQFLPHLLFVLVLVLVSYSIYMRLKFAHLDKLNQRRLLFD